MKGRRAPLFPLLPCALSLSQFLPCSRQHSASLRFLPQADPQSGTRLVTDDALSVYVEFNTSYRLQVEDTVNMPLSEKKVRGTTGCASSATASAGLATAYRTLCVWQACSAVRCGVQEQTSYYGSDGYLSPPFVPLSPSHALCPIPVTPQSSQLLDEVTTCWAMISFKKCAVLQREVSISVPLYYGSIYDPKPMDAYYAAQRA